MSSTASPPGNAAGPAPSSGAGLLPRRWPPDFPPATILRYRRTIIIGLHLGLIPLGYALAYLLRFEVPIPQRYALLYWSTLPLLMLFRLAAFVQFRLLHGWWRYVGMYDLVALLKAVTVSSALFAAALFLTGNLSGFPRSVFLLDWGIAILIFGGIRFGVRWFREGGLRRSWERKGKRTLIIGAGDVAAHLLRQVRLDSSSEIEPIGLVDDDPNKRWIHLHGVPVLGTTRDLERLVAEHRIDLLVVAIAAAGRDQMRRIAERCAGLQVEFKILPSLRELIDGNVRLAQLRTVQVEDLLGRPSVNLDLERVKRDLQGKAVIITGAAGSIGSELARQVAGFDPASLVLLDQAESPLYFVESELSAAHPSLEIVPVIADVTDAKRLEEVFAEHRPEYVFHAAAYKHVPMMEANVSEAVRNNVVGTFRLARCATWHGVGKFVLISTDKAVRPSSVMGASKRIAERIVLGWPDFRSSSTDFRAVRFGNVLGSTGSVIPLFNRQIAEGGPVTVTHPDMKRYFMTIPEAVQLVLEASALNEAADRISMLDMGEPVRIVEMAENLIRLSGLEPYTEMPIVISGIRPGEKLHEDLMSEFEQTIGTVVDKVRVVQTDETDGAQIQDGLTELTDALSAGDRDRVVHALCALVPECVPPLSDKGEEAAARLAERRASEEKAQAENLMQQASA